jgi:hypothetical protein
MGMISPGKTWKRSHPYGEGEKSHLAAETPKTATKSLYIKKDSCQNAEMSGKSALALPRERVKTLKLHGADK